MYAIDHVDNDCDGRRSYDDRKDEILITSHTLLEPMPTSCSVFCRFIHSIEIYYETITRPLILQSGPGTVVVGKYRCLGRPRQTTMP